MFRKTKVNRHNAEGEAAMDLPSSPPAKLQILSIPDKVKLLASESLVDYPTGLSQPFSKQELVRLKKRFATLLSPEEPSLLSIQAFLLMPELRLYPLVPFVADLVLKKSKRDADTAGGSGDTKAAQQRGSSLTFEQFLTILAIFSPKQDLDCKRRVLFDVFDADSDGSVTIHNFLFVLARISSVSASTLRSSIEAKVKPLRETQQDKESNKWPGLAFDEFYQVMSEEEVASALTILY